MPTALTTKGQVTIPKHIRDALKLRPGMGVDFSVSASGEVVLHPAAVAKGKARARADRFESVRGKADVKWRTDDLMALLRAES